MQHTSMASCVTHPALHLRDANDAHVVFEAVRLKLLPLVKRRLTSDERDHLTSGNVFVWEEAEHKGGLERWTDGRRWSQSRMKGEYLFYEEKIETTQEEKQAKAARRAHRSIDPSLPPSPPSRRQDRPSKPDGLTKQTYSTYVYLNGSVAPRKWHIVAYFSASDYARLPVIENYDYLRNVQVPEGVFFSSKGAVKKNDNAIIGSNVQDLEVRTRALRVDTSVIPSAPPHHSPTYRRDLNGWTDSSNPAGSYTLTGDSPTLTRSYAYRGDTQEPTSPLPRLSPVAPLQPHPYAGNYRTGDGTPHAYSPRSASQPYAPLSMEDRRALNTFRVVL